MEIQRRRFLTYLVSTVASIQLNGCGVLSEGSMKPSNSAEKLRQFLAARNINESQLMAPQLISNGIEFYKSVSCSGLAADPQADMLLVQWGVFDWRMGEQEQFEFDLTRQFTRSGVFGDDAISQLRITAYYPPTQALRAIKAENRWCSSFAELTSFENFIRSSAAFKAVSSLTPSRVAIEWTQV